MPKDTGELTSRLGQIKRQAAKVPGPGMYLGNTDWKLKGGFVFSKTSRDKGLRLNTVPAPGQYDNSQTQLTKPRSIGGPLPKGTKRSFLDQAVEKSGKTPAPDKYQPQYFRPHVAVPSMSHGKRTESRVKRTDKGTPGPGHYEPKYTAIEQQLPNYGTAKDTGNSFVDRVTKMKEKLPAPGHYEAGKMDKITRGGKWVQLMQLPRGPLMGKY